MNQADRAEIWAYLATEAPEVIANRFVTKNAAAFGPVRHFPLAAPARRQFAPGLRVTFHGAYAISYRPLSGLRHGVLHPMSAAVTSRP